MLLRCFQMSSQYQRSVPLEVRRAEGERVRAKHPDKIPVSMTTCLFVITIILEAMINSLMFDNVSIHFNLSSFNETKSMNSYFHPGSSVNSLIAVEISSTYDCNLYI